MTSAVADQNVISKLRNLTNSQDVRVVAADGTEFRAFVDGVPFHNEESDPVNTLKHEVHLGVHLDDVDRLGMPLTTAYLTATGQSHVEETQVTICSHLDESNGTPEARFTDCGEIAELELID